MTLDEERAMVRKETLVSTLPNAVISALFVWLLFGGQPTVPLWGPAGLAVDLLPTTLMLTLMTTIGLTLLVRHRRRRGSPPAHGSNWLPRHPLLRGLMLGALMLVLFVPVSVALLALVWGADWSFATVLVFKIGYGVLLGWVVTPIVVRAALRDSG
ncbi:hypothetical protein GCM10007973_05530 [Polymorphobacter multimanifer]|uniref:Uncharacterized protein n=1 Tax=Polymorphobacter multimanifer TaxID=1070431 RepID=A0A841LC96_9SPHN|nr:hypothetical protein [Polymorphobacter multimanifer]MBB6226762.1 hypothetical protein [Polymorphobacter multimanifer]GGI71451.1 hypothetical protein GCM10007973_05530 [Polymorphobacter multimanifer]